MEETEHPPGNEVVAERVRTELTRKRMSQAELARRLHRTEVYISRRLRGEVEFGAVELAHVATVLHVPVEQLLAGAA